MKHQQPLSMREQFPVRRMNIHARAPTNTRNKMQEKYKHSNTHTFVKLKCCVVQMKSYSHSKWQNSIHFSLPFFAFANFNWIVFNKHVSRYYAKHEVEKFILRIGLGTQIYARFSFW